MKKLKKFVLSTTFTKEYAKESTCFKPDVVASLLYDQLEKIFFLNFEHDDVIFLLQIEKDLWDNFLNVNEKDLYITFNNDLFVFVLESHSIGFKWHLK